MVQIIFIAFSNLLKNRSAVSQILQRTFSRTQALRTHISKHSVNAQINKTLLEKYMELPQPDNTIIVKYVWIDGTGEYLRAKSRTLNFVPKGVKDIPIWNYDGSSTFQAQGTNSDTYLCPVALYNDPFRGGNNKLVLCDTYGYDKKPTKTNLRNACNEAMDCIADSDPLWGIEQEYTMLDTDYRPFGWPPSGFPAPQGPYYCGVGADRVHAREVIEAHYKACLYAGIELAGTNMEVMPAQAEYQIGPSKGIKGPDDLWMSRFILHRIAEEYGIIVTLDPKPVPGEWNGAGAHTNFSTKEMRDEGGMKHIEAAIHKLAKRHEQHIKVYDPTGGVDNRRRLSGACETSSLEKFSYGIANRAASVRIPRAVGEEGKGYFEDRRPAANMDPYAVCNAIVRTCFIDDVK